MRNLSAFCVFAVIRSRVLIEFKTLHRGDAESGDDTHSNSTRTEVTSDPVLYLDFIAMIVSAA